MSAIGLCSWNNTTRVCQSKTEIPADPELFQSRLIPSAMHMRWNE